MSVREITISERMTKKCSLCDLLPEVDSPALEFNSGGIGRNTTVNRVCIQCLIGIVEDYQRKKK